LFAKGIPIVVKPIRSLEDALDRCQLLGMRVSRQRRFILELLWHDQEHLSAREIYDRLTQRGKHVGHTSVYQNLEALSRQGIIECIEHADGRRYGNISDPHSHVHCLDSDRIVDVHVELPPELIAWVEAQTGTRITDYRIDFYGQQQAVQTGDLPSRDLPAHDLQTNAVQPRLEEAQPTPAHPHPTTVIHRDGYPQPVRGPRTARIVSQPSSAPIPLPTQRDAEASDERLDRSAAVISASAS
jgi:Fur family ferric uptake transcriptional regulator